MHKRTMCPISIAPNGDGGPLDRIQNLEHGITDTPTNSL